MADPVATLIAHTTANTDPASWTCSENVATFGSGTIDDTSLWVAGDLIVVCAEDSATATTLALTTTQGGGSVCALEALAADADESLAVSDCDVASGAGSQFLRVWSSRITTLTANGINHPLVTVAVDFNGSSGVRRAQLWRIRPGTGHTIPVRASRKKATGTATNTTSSAGTTTPITMSADPGALEVALIGLYYSANSLASACQHDPDNDGGTPELTAQGNSNACGSLGKAYTVTGANSDSRPNRTASSYTETFTWVSNPSSSASYVALVAYELESATNASAELIAKTGTANAPTATVSPSPGLPSGTGTAIDPTVITTGPTAHPNVITGTGTANAPTPTVKPSPGLTSGTGTAISPTVVVTYPPIDVATETDIALDFIATKYFSAELSVASPASGDAVIGATLLASMTEAADAGDIRIALKQAGVELATSGWQALTTTPTLVSVAYSYATGTGFSVLWEVRTSSFVDAIVSDVQGISNFIAVTATGTGTARPPTTANPDCARGTGQARTVSANPRPNGDVATPGAGVAYQPTSFLVAPALNLGTNATGVSRQPSATVKTNTECATGTGAALQPTIVSFGLIQAERATGTGLALQPSITQSFTSTSSNTNGVAYDAAIQTSVPNFTSAQAELATGTGLALDIGAPAALVSGIGQARDPAILLTFTVDVASGTGVARVPVFAATPSGSDDDFFAFMG